MWCSLEELCVLVLKTYYCAYDFGSLNTFIPVVESVSDVHVVGELFPQGSLQLTLGLDGLQGLTQLALGNFFQSDGVLQLAVEKLGVLLQATDLVLQTLKLHLRTKRKENEKEITLMSFGFTEM